MRRTFACPIAACLAAACLAAAPLAAACLAAAPLAAAAPAAKPPPAAAAWPDDVTDPHPMPDDLVLPMPCGGRMAFRPVLVPSTGPLDDARIALGGLAKEYGYKEYQHADYIAGGFAAPDAASGRLYYLAKYDVTQAQFAAVGPAGAPAACAPLGDGARLPQTGVGWTQAAAFAEAYAGWLVAAAKDRLPAEGGAPGFPRLPTEEEWEYAARGGARVAAADFAAPLFPMTAPLARYVWYQGTESSNGRLQPVGLLQPNPLGLFDMLGDAAQLTSTLFRLNHVSRLHGQSGGYVVKGGSYLTPPDQIRSAARDEFAPVDGRGPHRLATVGFRLALVAPAVPNRARLRAIETDWAALPEAASGGGSLAEPVQTDPVKEAEAIAAAVPDPALKARIEGLELAIAANIKTRNDQIARAARSSLDLASWIAQKTTFDAIRLLAARQVAEIGKSIGRTADAARVPPRQQELTNTIDTYRDILRTLYTEYPRAVRDQQSGVLSATLTERGLKERAALLPGIETDIATMQSAGDLPAAEVQARAIAAYCAGDDGRKAFPDACKTSP